MIHDNDDKTYIHIGTASSKSVEVSHNRLHVVIILFAIAFLVISLRVFDVSVISGENTASVDMESDSAPEQITKRADIVDRNGIILATSLTTASVYANPKVMLDKQSAFLKLSQTFPDLDKTELKNNSILKKTLCGLSAI